MKTRIPSGGEETKVKCRRCGFLCDTSRDKTGAGSGLRYESVEYDGSTVAYKDIVVAGCPMCGTKNYKNWTR